jgi:hypothetical protein
MNINNDILISRNFSVSYYQISDTLWIAQAELQDEQHNIISKLKISIPELKVEDAFVLFKRKPLEQCLEICEKVKELKGISVIHDLSNKLNELFLGPEGCPNVRNLFGISGPGFVYVYYPKLIQEGKISQMDWWKIVGTELKDDCIAHKRMHEKFSKQ